MPYPPISRRGGILHEQLVARIWDRCRTPLSPEGEVSYFLLSRDNISIVPYPPISRRGGILPVVSQVAHSECAVPPYLPKGRYPTRFAKEIHSSLVPYPPISRRGGILQACLGVRKNRQVPYPPISRRGGILRVFFECCVLATSAVPPYLPKGRYPTGARFCKS